MLIGTLEYETVPEGGYLRYNAAVVLDRNGFQPDYHAKMQLVPLGEWIPFSDKIKVLDNLDVGGAHFTAGKKLVLFDHPKGQYAAAICFESAFPDIIRRFAQHGARLLVSITNDGWYGLSSGPTQHALIAVYRAIETRRPIARSANTGISLLIDRAGRLQTASAQYVPDCIVGDLALGPRTKSTYFVRYGMYVGRLSTALTGTFLLLAVILDWRRRRSLAGINGPKPLNGTAE
jgi:apolipoprotein N-acyltransferase